MIRLGRRSQAYWTGGGDPLIYNDEKYARSFVDASNRMLAIVSSLPNFKVLECNDVDVGKFHWALAELVYTYEEDGKTLNKDNV